MVIGIGGQALGIENLEVSYPNIHSGVDAPTTTKTLLNDYILYIFYFALIFSGVIIFGSMLMAGISYMSSMGNPAALGDSRNRMSSAFLGVILLLSSFLLLSTINPEIVTMTLPSIANERFITLTFASGDEINIKSSNAFLPEDGAVSLSYGENTESDGVDIIIYSEIRYEGSSEKITDAGSLPFHAKSIVIAWKLPGVRLFPETDYGGDPHLYLNSSGSLGGFDDKAKSISIYSIESNDRLMAVLHEDEAFQGKCAVIYGEEKENLNNEEYGGIVGNSKTSSITVLKPRRTELGSLTGGVKFFDKNGDQIECSGPYCESENSVRNVKTGSTGGIGIADDKIYGLEITGSYAVILFKDTNFRDKCEVFTSSNSDFSDNAMGKCPSGICFCIPILDWCPPCVGSCVSSLIVFPLDQ